MRCPQSTGRLIEMRIDARGFSLMELIIASAIYGVVVLGVGFAINQIVNLKIEAESLNEIHEFRSHIFSTVDDPVAWSNTVVANQSSAAMLCLLNGTSCAPGGVPITDRPFRLLNQSGGEVYDSIDPTRGFTGKGTPCTNFSLTAGDASCPFRFDLRWSAVCDPANCINPQIKISNVLSVSQSYRNPLNPVRVSINGYYVMSSVGTCGPANGQPETTIPVGASLCSTGTPSAVAGSGPWNWQCMGPSGGPSVNCATTAVPASAVCGTGSGSSGKSLAMTMRNAAIMTGGTFCSGGSTPQGITMTIVPVYGVAWICNDGSGGTAPCSLNCYINSCSAMASASGNPPGVPCNYNGQIVPNLVSIETFTDPSGSCWSKLVASQCQNGVFVPPTHPYRYCEQ